MAIIDPLMDKPDCPCCRGNGMHYLHAVAVGAASPDDTDTECSLCNGTGRSWFESFPNSCSAWRDLNRRH